MKAAIPYKVGRRTIDLAKAMAVYRYDYELPNGKMRFYLSVFLRGGLIFDDAFYSKKRRDFLYEDLQFTIKRLYETFKDAEDL